MNLEQFVSSDNTKGQVGWIRTNILDNATMLEWLRELTKSGNSRSWIAMADFNSDRIIELMKKGWNCEGIVFVTNEEAPTMFYGYLKGGYARSQKGDLVCLLNKPKIIVVSSCEPYQVIDSIALTREK